MVETRLPNDLAEFEGDFSLEGLRLWKTAFSAMTQNPRPGSPLRNGQGFVNKESSDSHKMVEDKKIVIMPCKCAPSRQLVQAWLQAKEEYVRSKKLSKTEPTGVVKSTKNFSASVNPYDKPVVPPKMDITPHILPTTAHTKEDVDNAQIALQVPATESVLPLFPSTLGWMAQSRGKRTETYFPGLLVFVSGTISTRRLEK